MDVVVYALCKKLIADSISSIGNVFTLQGTLLSENDLPMSGNKSGDLYLVGPMSDGSFDEYYKFNKEEIDYLNSFGTIF